RVARDKPFVFHATLKIPKPVGDVHVVGRFASQRGGFGKSALSGAYTLENANLDPFPGIAGTLSSHGTFGGTLDHLRADGATDAPNFQVTSSGNLLDLKTQFEAF